MNLVLWSKGSSGAVPFSTLIALLALWFCVSVPLTFVGAYLGFRKRVCFYQIDFTDFFLSKSNFYSQFDFFFLNLNYFFFFRFPQAIGASGANKSNSTSNTGSIDLYTTNTRHYNGRCLTIWMHIHSVVFHFEFIVVQPNVLHVWFLIFGILDFSDHLFRNNDPIMLFPSMCRRLSLVVAIIFNIRLYSILFVHLLLPLFCNKIIDRRYSINILVFRLYTDNGIFIFPNDRFNWFYGLFLVHSKNIQCR